MMRREMKAWREAMVIKAITIEATAPRSTGTRTQKRAPSPPERATANPAMVPPPRRRLTRSAHFISVSEGRPASIPEATTFSSILAKTSRREAPIILERSTAREQIM